MPKINQEEYELLKSLDDKWKWVLRDNFNLMVYAVDKEPVARPHQLENYGPLKGDFSLLPKYSNDYFNITELIEEYEYSTEHVSHVVNERVKALDKAWRESEETEVSKQEIIQALNNLKNTIEISDPRNNGFKYTDGIKSVVDKILPMVEKLPEQETLSPVEGILKEIIRLEELEKDIEKLTGLTLEEIKEEARSGGIVLKQEEVDQAYKAGYETGKDHATRNRLPVIPKFVAEHIDDCKERELTMHGLFYTANKENIIVANWMTDSDDFRERQELMGRAWLDGYEVESEKKYRITVAGHYVMFDTYGNMKTVTYGDSITNEQSMKKVRFDIEKAIKSGIMEVEEVEE